VIKDGNKIVQAVQVCFDLNKGNKNREVNGLLEAINYFKLKEGIIITFDQEDKFKIEDKIIKLIPVWKWLLEK